MTTDTNKLPAEVLERMAREIDPSSWRVFDGYLAEMLRKYKGEDAGYDASAFKDKASMALAQAAYDASPGPALEAENARLRGVLKEAEAHLAEYLAEIGSIGRGGRSEKLLSTIRTAIARAKGE